MNASATVKGLKPAMPLLLAGPAAYFVWRIMAHRFHIRSDISIAAGIYTFIAGAYLLAVLFRSGTKVLWSAAVAVIVPLVVILSITGLGIAILRSEPIVVRNPGLSAAFLLLMVGAIGAIRRFGAR